MATADAATTPLFQWKPKSFKVSLRLSTNSLKKEVPFFSLINMSEGFTLPSGAIFTATQASEKAITVQLSICNHGAREKDHIAFSTSSTLQEVSIACSKLNMAEAQKCQIMAHLDGKDKVTFSIIPSNEAAERKLINLFALFD